MPGSASMTYKTTSRPIGVVGAGVGGVGERRAMGDSSHYEEIALIGNGQLSIDYAIAILSVRNFFHGKTNKNNGVFWLTLPLSNWRYTVVPSSFVDISFDQKIDHQHSWPVSIQDLTELRVYHISTKRKKRKEWKKEEEKTQIFKPTGSQKWEKELDGHYSRDRERERESLASWWRYTLDCSSCWLSKLLSFINSLKEHYELCSWFFFFNLFFYFSSSIRRPFWATWRRQIVV